MFNLVLTLLLILPFCLKCLDYRDDVLHKKDFINVNTAISTIPYIIDHASPDFVKAYGPLYDQKRTENCLRGHNILLFGDSLTEELVFDLAILLSGVSKNKNELDAFIEQGTGETFLHLFCFFQNKITIIHSTLLNFIFYKRFMCRYQKL